MDKHSNNNQSSNHNQSGTKVRSIDELLAAKRASNKLGNDKANQDTKRATDSVRENAGKAKRSQLRDNLVKTAELAKAEGEEEGIKQFLSEDIPTVMNALNSELRSSHIALVEANEAKLIEGSVVDVDWSDYETDYDMSFEPSQWTNEWVDEESWKLEGTSEASKSLPSIGNNPFNSDDLPE